MHIFKYFFHCVQLAIAMQYIPSATISLCLCPCELMGTQSCPLSAVRRTRELPLPRKMSREMKVKHNLQRIFTAESSLLKSKSKEHCAFAIRMTLGVFEEFWRTVDGCNPQFVIFTDHNPVSLRSPAEVSRR